MISVQISLKNWEGSVAGDTTVVSSVSCHLDVSSSSPLRSPGVLDQEVVLTSFASVSDGKDGVVHAVGRTAWGVVDTRSVTTDTGRRGINGDGHWTNTCDGVSKARLASSWCVLWASVVGNNLTSVKSTITRTWLVGISLFRFDTTGSGDVLPWRLESTSLTSVVTITSGTIDDLFLRHADQLSTLLLPLTWKQSPSNLNGNSLNQWVVKETH